MHQHQFQLIHRFQQPITNKNVTPQFAQTEQSSLNIYYHINQDHHTK